MIEKFSTTNKRIVEIIGEATEHPTYGELELSRLKQLAIGYSMSFSDLQQALSTLLSDNLISEHFSHNNNKGYRLTVKGRQIYDAIRNQVGLVMPYEHIGIETFTTEGLESEIAFVEAFFENWMGNLAHWLGDALYDNKALENNLFFCYIASQTAVFDWLAHSLLSGAYDVVLRELRSIMEGLFVAYTLDINYPTQSLEEKLETMSLLEKQGKTHGKRVFKESAFDKWEHYYAIYRELCAYVHISRKVTGQQMIAIAKQGFSEIIEPKFDKDTFLRCVRNWRDIAQLSTEFANALLTNLGAKGWRINPSIFGQVS